MTRAAGRPVEVASKLVAVHVPRNPVAAVLVLHGGGSRADRSAVSPTQLSVLRMIPIARRAARADRRRLAVFRLLNSTRGWDTARTPVDDVRWALGEVSDRFGGRVPVGLIGHSLGGRAALLSADHPKVVSVVALAPWLQPEDGRVDASGTRVLIVHGTDDRIASAQRSTAAAVLLRRSASSLAYVSVEGGKHAMLARHQVFSGLAAEFTAAALLPDRRAPSARVRELLAGADHPVVI